MRRLPSGFTLIEIMVVVVIIGIIAAMVAPSVIRRIDDAQIAKAKQDLRAYATALDLFRLDNYKYPTTDQGLTALVQQPGDSTIRNWKPGGYIGGLRKDPWNNDYHYVYPGTKGQVNTICSRSAPTIRKAVKASTPTSAIGTSTDRSTCRNDFQRRSRSRRQAHRRCDQPSACSARTAGFTLIEILVVVVIIGVMAAAATLSMGILGRDQLGRRTVAALLGRAATGARGIRVAGPGCRRGRDADGI